MAGPSLHVDPTINLIIHVHTYPTSGKLYMKIYNY